MAPSSSRGSHVPRIKESSLPSKFRPPSRLAANRRRKRKDRRNGVAISSLLAMKSRVLDYRTTGAEESDPETVYCRNNPRGSCYTGEHGEMVMT